MSVEVHYGPCATACMRRTHTAVWGGYGMKTHKVQQRAPKKPQQRGMEFIVKQKVRSQQRVRRRLLLQYLHRGGPASSAHSAMHNSVRAQ